MKGCRVYFMNKFEFKSNVLELSIAGQNFTVDPLTASAKYKELVKKIDGIKEDVSIENISPKTVENACKTILECVDDILGSGASETIFKGRTVNYYDCIDLCVFVLQEVKGFNDARTAAYTVNREQRRKK